MMLENQMKPITNDELSKIESVIRATRTEPKGADIQFLAETVRDMPVLFTSGYLGRFPSI